MASSLTAFDVWILLSVIYGLLFSGESSDENAIMSAAEFIKGVRPGEDQLHNSLSRLLDAGFIQEDGGRYLPTDSAMEHYSQLHDPGDVKSEDVEEELRNLEQSLASLPD